MERETICMGNVTPTRNINMRPSDDSSKMNQSQLNPPGHLSAFVFGVDCSEYPPGVSITYIRDRILVFKISRCI